MAPDISLSQLLSAETTLELHSASFSDEVLHEFFRDHPDEPLVDAWLLANLVSQQPRAPALLRIARKAHAYWQGADDFNHLLFGLPIAVGCTPLNASWRTLHSELEQTLSFNLQELKARVKMCARPLASSTLHQLGATPLGNWCEALFDAQDPSAGLHELGLSGPAVWVGLVSVPHEHHIALEKLFFRLNPEMTRLFSGTNVRMEALAEEQGVSMRLYPPTAYWNSLSISRLVTSRIELTKFKAQAKPWVVSFHDGTATLSDERVNVWSQPFPEESKADIWPLFSGWAQESN
jgi:hypothetical protein